MAAVIPGAVQASDLTTRTGLKALVYGHPGIGKTKTAAGLRLAGQQTVLVIDCEGGALTLAGMENVIVRRISEWTELEALYRFLRKNAKELNIGTVVIDTLSAVQRLGLDYILSTSKTPNLPNRIDWAQSNEQLGRMTRDFIDMADTRIDTNTGQAYFGWNIVFTSHIDESKNDVTGEIMLRPSFTPKFREMVCGVVDIVALLTTEPASNSRVIVMDNWGGALGKVRQPSNLAPIPTKLLVPNWSGDDASRVPTLLRILQHLHGEVDLNERDKYPELFPPRTQPTATDSKNKKET